MELVQYIRLVRKWLWLIVIAAFVTGCIGFIVSSSRPPVYEARTTIAIGRFIESPNPDSADIRTGIDLAQTYAQIVTTFDVLQGTIDALQLPMDVDELRRLINTRIITGTSLLVLSITNSDPVMAADIANGLAQQLILKSPTNLTPDQQGQIDFANAQIADLNAQIVSSRGQLALVETQLSSAQSEAEIERLTEQRNSIVEQINQASATIAQFSNTISTLQQRTNALDIVEQARVPTEPTGASVLSTSILAALVGAVLAFGGALLFEYLDDTIRTTEDSAQIMALPVLGGIVRFGKKSDPYPERLVNRQPTMSAAVEGYRTVRTNLMFNAENTPKGIYIITSASPSEGKSVTAANLALSMAESGLQVLLIDCDLRRPKIHEIFQRPNNVGLTTLLNVSPEDQVRHNGSLPTILLQCLQTTNLAKLWIITSGFVPYDPTELLGSSVMQSWIEIFRASPEIDVVILDTSPCLVAADSSILAATTKAEVIMVIDAGHTRRGAALKAKEQFVNLGVPIRGLVVNRINPREESYGYGYNYYTGYYTPIEGEDGQSLRDKILGRRE